MARVLIVGGVRKDITVGCPEGYDASCGRKIPTQLYDEGFGGSAARAAKILAKLGHSVTLICKGANDDAGRLFTARMKSAGVRYLPVPVTRFPATVALVHGAVRSPLLYDHAYDDEARITNFPEIPRDVISGFEVLYLDGRLPHAALSYAVQAKENKVPVMLDACAGRHKTPELIALGDIVIGSEHFADELGLNPLQTLDMLKGKGCRLGAVTLSEYGVVWYNAEEGGEVQYLPALAVPRVVNVNGSGDVFHACFLESLLDDPRLCSRKHMAQARAGATHAIQHLENRARHPSLSDINAASGLSESTLRPPWLPQHLR